MKYVVLFAPEVLTQLDSMRDFIAVAASPIIADRYVDELLVHCQRLSMFPMRGQARDDLMPGLRITHYRGKATIAFKVDAAVRTVSILGVFHGRQDYASHLQTAR